MSDQVQQIKDRLNILDVIEQYVKLTKAGKNYKGLSPFSKEKTPSFFVSPDKGMYYDFSSGQGGDIFSFVEKIEGVDFKEALKMLAEKAGIELKYESKGKKNTRDKIYSALEEATQFFETKLQENTDAIKYLTNRGVEKSTIRSFRVGFALNKWSSLIEHLKGLNFTEKELELAGLIKKGESGKYYDRFRSRIMFPIMNSVGKVVAFSGRIYGEPAKDEKNAKYINSPETQLFNKSHILYGYNKAKQFIRKYDFTILVEGQMDIIMSHQAGYTNTVAVSGTGLTNEHLTLINRLSKKLVMAFDADPAGIKSSGRSAVLALKKGMDVKVAILPKGKDPADCIKENINIWKDAIKKSKHIVDFYIDIAIQESKVKKWDQRKFVLYTRDTVLPYVAQIKSATDQAHFVRNISNILNISEEAIWQDVRNIKTGLSKEDINIKNTIQPKNKYTEKRKLNRKKDLEETLAGFLFWHDTLKGKEKKLDEKILEKKSKELEIQIENIIAKYSNKKEELIFKTEILYKIDDDHYSILHTLMSDLAKENLLKERNEISQKLYEAERGGDEKEVEKILTDFKEINKKIEKIKNQ